MSILPSKCGNSTWLIDHATKNSKTKNWSRKKSFFCQTLLKWKKSKISKIAEIHLVTYIQHQDHGFFFHVLALKIWQILWKTKKRENFQLEKKKNSLKKIPSFCPNKQPKHWAGCKSQLSKTSKFACPWTILITSLTSAKPRRAVLGKYWTSGLGYVHSNFSNLFYFTNCWTDVQKNTMKERFLHFDQNMEKLSIYWRYP